MPVRQRMLGGEQLVEGEIAPIGHAFGHGGDASSGAGNGNGGGVPSACGDYAELFPRRLSLPLLAELWNRGFRSTGRP
jgi:hypothetical protein